MSSTFDTIQTTIFNVNCLGAGCHNGTDQAGDLVLVAGQSYANLINVVPFNLAAQAAGLLRVVPGNPDQSFLMIKLTGPPPDEGSQMPLSAPPLPASDIALVNAWILEGAPGPSAPSPTATRTSTLGPPTATPTSTPTLTPAPPTATFTVTRTRTPEAPTATPTATRTSTPELPTATPTPTPTNTSAPPTATPTATLTSM